MPISRRDLKVLLWLVAIALGACATTLITGLAVGITYSPLEPYFAKAGITLSALRATHESFAFAWIFLGGVSVVLYYLLTTHGPFSNAERRRTGIQIGLWAIAGVGIPVSFFSGSFSGREYLGYAPIFAILIVIGWLCFATTFYSRVGFSLDDRPMYVYMWMAGVALFIVTQLEGHLYLFELVSHRPLRDMALQWKTNGVMVGSFNLLAYGSLMYLGGKLKGDDSYAHSRTAFCLFTVGLLNTFTNYGHHTFHLPQTHLIHWISFLVSMSEIVILAKVLIDLLAVPWNEEVGVEQKITLWFVRSATVWTFLMLTVSLIISIPPLNSIIHGTHLIVAHAMGSMLGIDSMILWAALSYLLRDVVRRGLSESQRNALRFAVPLINISLFALWTTLIVRGLAAGWTRLLGPSAPDLSEIVACFPTLMLVAGTVLTVAVLWLVAAWLVAILRHQRTPA